MRKVSHFVALVMISMSLLFIDFLTKAYVFYLLPLFHGREVFHDVLGIDFSIALTANRGAAWGLLADFQLLLMVVRILVILGLLIYLCFINRDKQYTLPLTLLTTGAIGNVVDYFLYGYVIDFFQFNLWGYHFPVFNVADILITISVGWLLVIGCFYKRNPSNV